MPKQNNMGTYTIGIGVFPIVANDGVRVLAIKLNAGAAGTAVGSAKIGSFGPSAPIVLAVGEPTIFTNQDPMDGLTITITAGTALVITNQ